jgi:anaerobic magnesium-protoporphyrin IX monomethyl ester cyclase
VSKVLLTHSYFLRRDKKQWKDRHAYPPLATLYAASVLRDSGHDVSFFDTMFERSPEAIESRIRTVQPDVFVIYDDSFNYLTKMCLTRMQEASIEMIRVAKQHGCAVIVSGHDMSDHASLYLRAGVDCVIVGEAEATLREVVDSLEAGRSIQSIPGIAILRDGLEYRTEKREVLRTLDDLPVPAWDLVNLATYRATWMKKRGYFSINLATTRGCPFKCNWCAKPVYGNRYNSHSARYIVDEIKLLQSLTAFDHIWFADDIFGLKPGWIEELSRLLKAEGIRLRYKIQSRADLMTESVILALKSSGCEEVWMGVESGSQKILDAMEKGITLEQVREARTKLKRAGIRACFFLQFGYRGETLEDIRATESMLADLKPDDIGVSVSYPLPDTKFYELVKLELGPKTNWSDSDDLAVLYNTPYPQEYYRLLHRKVHWQFRLSQMKGSPIVAPSRALRSLYFHARVMLASPRLAAMEAER